MTTEENTELVPGHDFMPCYWWVRNAFSPVECQVIKAMAEDVGYEKALVGVKNAYMENDYRSNSVADITIPYWESWVRQRLMSYALEANDLYRFQLVGVQSMIVCKYENGQQYKEHMDIGAGLSQYRKLSIVVQLDKPEDYVGGALRFHGDESAREMGAENVNDPSVYSGQGTVVVFPSFNHHWVDPVTEGARHSLVAWVGGNRFQ